MEYKRRQYFINPKFQLKMIFFALFIVFMVSTMSLLSVQYIFEQLYSNGLSLGLAPNHPYFEFLQEQQILMSKVYFVSTSIEAIIIVISVLFLSHRIAGPLFNMTRHLTRVAAGQKPGPIQFRKKDFFKELAQAYNDSIRSK